MNAHYLQHVPFEGLGSIESWLEAAGYMITKTQFFKSAKLPEPDQPDLLVVMGGPMSVNDEDAFPWHGETFELPSGSIRLARSQGCENQAFQFGRSVVGFQFHHETTAVKGGHGQCC
jgi:GMP synthase-like glutamine amidotransferase